MRHPLHLITSLILSFVLVQSQPIITATARNTNDIAATVPTGFTDSLLLTINSATAITQTPDGRLLIASKGGEVRVLPAGSTNPITALALNSETCDDFERGLLGLTVDPNFATNHFIYLYQTFRNGSACPEAANPSGPRPYNRVLRYTLNNDNTASNPLILLANIPSLCGNHNAGDVQFGADGLLYIAAGDGGCALDGSGSAGGNNNARNRNLLSGKILRIAPDGSIPASNPYANTVGAVRCGDAGPNLSGGFCKETFAWGLRNPFRIAFRPGSNQFYINDVGQDIWEEIDEGALNADYGWNIREGHCANGSTSNCGAPTAGITNPIYDYQHTTGLNSITGGAFVVSSTWPAPYNNSYFFGDYGGKSIYRLVQSGSSYTRETFANGTAGNGIITLYFDRANSALYYALNDGSIRRITYAPAANRAPTAAASAIPNNGTVPLTVQFSSAGSSDPDGDALRYDWNFGDGSAHSTLANPAHIYSNAGTYLATLIVSDGRGGVSAPANAVIRAGNTPPSVNIISPDSSLRFRVGQALLLKGSATDAQDGDLSASMKWELLLVHVSALNPTNAHTHPFFNGTGNNLTVPSLPNPEDLDATAGSYMELRLSATDSQGAQTTITTTVLPNRVPITLNTQPAGLHVNVNGTDLIGPQTITSWEGYVLHVAAPLAQDSASGQYGFSAWSDGGAASHNINTPAQAASYTATFVPTPDVCAPVAITPNKAIPDNNPTLSCVDLPVGQAGYVTNAALRVGMSHTFIGDLRMQLMSPDGSTLTLLNRPGLPGAVSGDNANLLSAYPISFTSNAATSAEQMGNGSTLTTWTICRDDGRCTYRAAPDGDAESNLNSLLDFAGQNSGGTWKLCVSDNFKDDLGTLSSVALDLTCAATGPITPTPTPLPTPSPTPDPNGDVCAPVSITPNAALPDNAAAPTCFALPVSAAGLVTSATLKLALDHTFISDLKIQLRAPNSATLTLLNRPGYPATTYGDSSNLLASYPISFTSTSLNNAELMGNTIGGSSVVCRDDKRCGFKPNPDGDISSTLQSYAGVVGLSAQGQWQVCLTDMAKYDVGRLASATLDLTCKAPGLTVITPEPEVLPTLTPSPESTPAPAQLKAEEPDFKYEVWLPVLVNEISH